MGLRQGRDFDSTGFPGLRLAWLQRNDAVGAGKPEPPSGNNASRRVTGPTPSPGGAAGTVLENHAFGLELVEDAVGLGEVLGLARRLTSRDQHFDGVADQTTRG